MTTTLGHSFNRAKPYYPLVINYVSQLIGMKELLIRGVVGPRNLDEMIGTVIERDRVAGKPPSDPATMRKQLQQLAGPLQLRSEALGRTVDVGIDSTAQELVRNHQYLLPFSIDAAGTLLVMAHEISKDKPWHNGDPIWEFLRHCRNAVAHGGNFYFINGEPRRPANWGHFFLIAELHGHSLFKRGTKGGNDPGILSPGDPIQLLWEIEQTYPAMTA